MKLYMQDGKPYVGGAGDTLHPIERFADISELIEKASDDILSELKALSKTAGPVSLDRMRLDAPIITPRQDIICVGRNYKAHAEESARFNKETFGKSLPAAPTYFSKRVNRAAAPFGEISGHFDIVDSLDYEAELAVVIGRDCKNVLPADADKYIFGYTIVNDVSARNLQTSRKQWYFGKSLDGFTPIGPCIETETKSNLAIKSYVNGELRQNGNTELLIFDVPYLIADLSAGMTLKAGTIISTGTPAGVGMGFDPPKFLNKGDIVRCEIEGIGYIENTIGD